MFNSTHSIIKYQSIGLYIDIKIIINRLSFNYLLHSYYIESEITVPNLNVIYIT